MIPKTMKSKSYVFVYSMLIIAMLGIIKYVWINIGSVMLAFSITSESGEQVWSLGNFERFFLDFSIEGSVHSEALVNTLKYFGVYIGKTLMAFVVSFFFYKKIFGYKMFRVIFYLPCIISPIVLCYSFDNILTVYGPIWRFMNNSFGISYPELFAQTSTATPMILIFCLWSGFGTTLLIFVGAMGRIPEEIIEAGKIDGCTELREFIDIVLPLVWETLSTILLLTIIGVFTATGPILFFTKGESGTFTISFWIFNSVRNRDYNYPAAVGLFYTVVAIPVVFGARYLMEKLNSNTSY